MIAGLVASQQSPYEHHATELTAMGHCMLVRGFFILDHFPGPFGGSGAGALL